jgi:hypothetical protein
MQDMCQPAAAASKVCDCSKCQPKPKPKPNPNANRKCKEPHKEAGAVAPVDMPFTDKMRKIGVKEIIAFCYRLWDEAGEHSYSLLAPNVFIPDDLINNILVQFPAIKTINDIHCLVEQHTHVAKHATKLFSIIETLRLKFLSMLDVVESAHQVTNLSNAEEAPDGEVAVLEGKITSGKSEKFLICTYRTYCCLSAISAN